MKELTKKEMQKINGNGLSAGAIAAIVSAAVGFIVGIFDGYSRPYKCR